MSLLFLVLISTYWRVLTGGCILGERYYVELLDGCLMVSAGALDFRSRTLLASRKDKEVSIPWTPELDLVSEVTPLRKPKYSPVTARHS